MVRNDRVVTMPTLSVAVPMAFPNCEDSNDFFAVIRNSWAESTSLANWAMLELAKADVVRTVQMEKLPKFEPPPLYAHWTNNYSDREWWNGAAQSASCILRAVEKKYRKDRYKIVWQRRQALPTYRYPYPYRVHNQSWRLSWVGGRPQVTFRLPGGRQTITLRSGQEYRRQMRLLQRIGDDAKPGEMLIKWNSKKKLLVCIITLTIPAISGSDAGVMDVATCSDHFLVATIADRDPWILNADHIRRWIVAHKQYLDRIAEDTKHEKRWPRRVRRHINEKRAERCRKQNDRIKSWCHESTAQLVGFAKRQKIGKIVLDNSNQDYLLRFPWFEWREKLKYKCQLQSIELHVAGKETETDDDPIN